MNKPSLTFNCPENWNGMNAVPGGKHCAKCDKVVTDLTKFSNEEILQTISSSCDDHFCGRVKPVQLEKPFGDKRDKVVSFYQRSEGISKKRYFVRTLQLGLATLLLFLTSCHRHVQGRMKFYIGDPRMKTPAEQQKGK